jgi:hypothetical protein
MSKFERLLTPDTCDLPDCQCGAEMVVASVQPGSSHDTEVKVYRCPNCARELRLTLWADDGTGRGPVSGC